MRSLRKTMQKVWFVEFDEDQIGVNTVRIYGKPKMKKLSVSATSGLPLSFSSGFSLKYSRYITCYDRKYQEYAREGILLFVDGEPLLDQDGELIVDKEYELDAEGNIAVDEDGEPKLKRITYSTTPDYMLMEILDTKKGKVSRFGIKKV